MSRRMAIMLISVGILFGGIFIYHGIKNLMMKRFLSVNQQPVVTVSATTLSYKKWRPELKATGSLRAIKGVNITTEIAGMVQTIYFTPGAYVKKGAKLVQLNADAEIAQLNSLKATAELAKTTYARNKAQFEIQAISKAALDLDAADFKNKQALVAQQVAIVNKKTIQAPFSGRLGISAINLGQYLNPGDKIVALQTLDPIYADFFVPQQTLVQLKVRQLVSITTDSFPGRKFTGKITTIDSAIDPATRNVQVEATIGNPGYDLVPGMFTSVQVQTGLPQEYLTLPQAAISFNPYGDIVYVIKETGKDKAGKPILKVKQVFITTGDTRGDQIAILKGLNEGDKVVTSGQVKLKNGSLVMINNKVTPAENQTPMPVDE